MTHIGLGETNEAGEQLEDFCLEHEMALANTMFKQHPRRLYTWTSPGGNTRNQIDYKTKTTQYSASESRGTQGRQNSAVCSKGVQQVYGIGGCM